jgi:hypothetical protein
VLGRFACCFSVLWLVAQGSRVVIPGPGGENSLTVSGLSPTGLSAIATIDVRIASLRHVVSGER